MIEKNGYWASGDDDLVPMIARSHARFSAIRDHVKRTRLAIDVGAHVGIYAVYLSMVFERVIAFEPLLESFDCLVRNVDLDRVTVRNMAISDSLGTSAMLAEPVKTSAHLSTVGTQPVLVRTIDSFGLDPDFIKIDAEGFDLKVLNGASWTLRQSRPVVMVEDKPRDRHPHWYRKGQIAAFLSELGMKCVFSDAPDQLWVWP